MDYPLDLSFKIIALAPQVFVTDAHGGLVYYVRQKLFKLKEAVTVYSVPCCQDHYGVKIRWILAEINGSNRVE